MRVKHRFSCVQRYPDSIRLTNLYHILAMSGTFDQIGHGQYDRLWIVILSDDRRLTSESFLSLNVTHGRMKFHLQGCSNQFLLIVEEMFGFRHVQIGDFQRNRRWVGCHPDNTWRNLIIMHEATSVQNLIEGSDRRKHEQTYSRAIQLAYSSSCGGGCCDCVFAAGRERCCCCWCCCCCCCCVWRSWKARISC